LSGKFPECKQKTTRKTEEKMNYASALKKGLDPKVVKFQQNFAETVKPKVQDWTKLHVLDGRNAQMIHKAKEYTPSMILKQKNERDYASKHYEETVKLAWHEQQRDLRVAKATIDIQAKELKRAAYVARQLKKKDPKSIKKKYDKAYDEFINFKEHGIDVDLVNFVYGETFHWKHEEYSALPLEDWGQRCNPHYSLPNLSEFKHYDLEPSTLETDNLENFTTLLLEDGDAGYSNLPDFELPGFQTRPPETHTFRNVKTLEQTIIDETYAAIEKGPYPRKFFNAVQYASLALRMRKFTYRTKTFDIPPTLTTLYIHFGLCIAAYFDMDITDIFVKVVTKIVVQVMKWSGVDTNELRPSNFYDDF